MIEEAWKPVVGWEGLYEVSDRGRVRNVRTGYVKKQHRHGNMYWQVWLCDRRVRDSCVLVQRLVLEAFRGPAPEGHEAAHEDGNPDHNTLGNLRWATPQSNAGDKERHGTLRRGAESPHTDFTVADVLRIREARLFGAPLTTLASTWRTTLSNVSAICLRKSWQFV